MRLSKSSQCLPRYFVGGLFLPIFNGPNEGIFIVMAILLLTGFSGDYATFWLKESFINGLAWNEFLFYVVTIVGTFTLIMK